MTIVQLLLAEFEQEAVTTRRFLERLPDDRLTWKAHEKSMTAGQLALHIATAPGGIVQMALADEFPMPNTGAGQPESSAQVLAALDESIATVRKTLSGLNDDRLWETWNLVMDGNVVLSMPRYNVLRSILLNHWIHHRGQFGVYLRLVGAKVPSSYGPSGDEPPEFMRKSA
jgi:uncharacterized damage-inducible protein DinB